MAKTRKTTRHELSDEAISEARREAEQRVRRRENNELRSKYVAELATITQMLEDTNHPLWRALALIVLPKTSVAADESFPDAINRIIGELATSAPEALQITMGFLLADPVVDKFGGKKQARPGESEKTTLMRVLLEEGASSYAAARAVGGHRPDVQSAALPEAEVRRARRLQAAVRKDALDTHQKLSTTVIPHRAVLLGPALENVKDAFSGLVDSAVRAAERREATVVKNIDRQRRKSGRARRR